MKSIKPHFLSVTQDVIVEKDGRWWCDRVTAAPLNEFSGLVRLARTGVHIDTEHTSFYPDNKLTRTQLLIQNITIQELDP